MNVTRNDISHQRMNGWLQMVPDGHTLWVRGQGIEQPVIFYTQQDNRPHELVIRRVTEDTVLGYLLVPAQTGGDNSVSTAGNTQVSYSAVPTR